MFGERDEIQVPNTDDVGDARDIAPDPGSKHADRDDLVEGDVEDEPEECISAASGPGAEDDDWGDDDLELVVSDYPPDWDCVAPLQTSDGARVPKPKKKPKPDPNSDDRASRADRERGREHWDEEHELE